MDNIVFSEHVLVAYDSGTALKEIIMTYGLDMSVSKLATKIPPLMIDQICQYCGESLFLKKRRRIELGSQNPPTCLRCGHKTNVTCRCSGCNEWRDNQQRDLRRAELNHYLTLYPSRKDIDFLTLSFREQFLILAFVKSYGNEDYDFSTALNSPNIPMVPISAPAYEEILTLAEKGALQLVGVSKSKLDGCYPLEIHDLAFKPTFELDYPSAVEQMQKNLSNEETKGQFTSIGLWLDQLEVFDLVGIHLSEAKFVFLPGKQTTDLIGMMAKRYKLYEISYLIHLAVKNTTLYVRQNPRSKRHEYSTFVSNLEHSYMRAVSENWNIKGYLPKSFQYSSSRFLFNMLAEGVKSEE